MPSNSKSCHNCRRRRLRCDRSWPGCHKCAISGQECLGYGKVFVWTQATDAQRNPIPTPGLRTPIGCCPPDLTATAVAAAAAAAAAITANNSAPGAYEVTGYFPAFPDSAATSGPSPGGPGHESHGIFVSDASSVPGGVHQALARYPSPPQTDNRDDAAVAKSATSDTGQDALATAAVAATATAAEPMTPQFWKPPALAALTDPLFQDLDRNSRYYLSHFADRVCKDLVARDAPGANPFRELIPLTNRHPLLLQILVATSAIHWSNIFRPITAIPTGLTDPGGYLAQLRSKDLVSRQALIDALTAKQKAMGHLQEVLDTLDPAGSEVALAATHFFIKFDLIDLDKSEGKSWRAHLQGASSILALLTSTPEGGRSDSNLMLRDCVIADCFIYHILGSTLASGSLAANIARYAFELMPVMKRVEANSYLSCPPEILHIILKASQLSYEAPCTDWSLSAADKALALIDEALAFDIPEWAQRLQRNHNVSDIDSRMHIASAHRSAVCLYILQALPLVRSVRPVDTEFLVGDILTNLGQISEADPYFKATSWPTFIAGAETRDAERRTWAMKRLLGIWEICPWGYIFTAIEMLKATWEMQDANHRANGETATNWLKGLQGMGFDYLIV
ncbi:Acriflavine sensitivity control protein acr-2 [Cladobotryum mycophilum]|uniref:Acriflavine sensitivity control protein acr-2 n=1 Tax=Cladobotryum mycophilum TaxID=491253 RepID=A0ABR0S8U4_9HYPO